MSSPANKLKTEAEIRAIRTSGQMLATVLEHIKNTVQTGMSPRDVSALAARELRALGGEAAFYGFEGYPDVICISVNSQVQHAIPNNVPFAPGDVVNFDFGVRYQGMITDAGITVCIDNDFSPDTKRLIKGTQEALYKGIDMVKDGVHVGDISHAIEKTLRRYHLGIVRELVGHGVGHHLHEEPEIPNYGPAGQGPILKAGMTIAIEPITTLGRHGILQDADGWTLWTEDNSLAAQFEHTLLVTESGCEILTELHP